VCHAPWGDLLGSGKLDAVLLTGFPAGILQTNCYVLARSAGAEAIVVDPGQGVVPGLRRVLAENRLTPAAVLLTHGHIDHIWSAQRVCDKFGIPCYIHSEDRAMLADPIRGLGPRLAQVAASFWFTEPKRVVELADGDKLEIAGTTVTVDHTPGHTPGSVVFGVTEVTDDGPVDRVFSGDTLFRQSVGRTDLPGGSGRQLLNSIVTKLLVLDDKTVVLPGHGESTTIGVERRTNPFLEGIAT
jgi:glyoxylase-like metal-dependent hydrolase (beta-lactamase superfamily II)